MERLLLGQLLLGQLLLGQLLQVQPLQVQPLQGHPLQGQPFLEQLPQRQLHLLPQYLHLLVLLQFPISGLVLFLRQNFSHLVRIYAQFRHTLAKFQFKISLESFELLLSIV